MKILLDQKLFIDNRKAVLVFLAAPLFIQAFTAPPPAGSERDFRVHHPDPLSIDELKTLTPEPFFFPPKARQKERFRYNSTVIKHSCRAPRLLIYDGSKIPAVRGLLSMTALQRL